MARGASLASFILTGGALVRATSGRSPARYTDWVNAACGMRTLALYRRSGVIDTEVGLILEGPETAVTVGSAMVRETPSRSNAMPPGIGCRDCQ